MATPQVPPRPARTQHSKHDASTTVSAIPQVPPRPSRRVERSLSPDRYAPSPLNEWPRNSANGTLYGNSKLNASSGSVDSTARPPSVTLPSIGQEGIEYADLELHEQTNPLQKTLSGRGTQTSHVDSDLPLHAPKPALSKPIARAQVAVVTRTDSSQAAAAGIGAASSASSIHSLRDESEPIGSPLKSKTSAGFMRSGSAMSTERPGSAQAEEQGIPQIGRQVPMLPNAGDVQAPSPAPGAQFPSGIGFHNDGTKPRHHGRTRSGREVFHPPPGSYGLHGHGVANTDKFEKDWYAKHPDVLRQEESGQYSPALAGPRPEWALSSNDLNKIVRETAKGSGFGTSPNVVGLPNEQIGYMASEEYANRINSPKTLPGHRHRHSNPQTHMESPLRNASFPADAWLSPSSDQAVDSEAEDVIHIDPPEERFNKITGDGVGSHEDLGPHGGNTDAEGGYVEERGYGVPILASDEITPGSEWMQPAVSPAHPPERRGSIPPDELGYLHRYASHNGSAASSRPGSRPGSVHGMPPLSKFQSHDDYEGLHTPLEDVEEYEPLFPDDEGNAKKPMTQAERLKCRPDMTRRFPSQDIWEDTPTSLKLEAEVTSPEPAGHQQMKPPPQRDINNATFETPEQEASRKGEVDEASREDLLSREQRLAKSRFQPHVTREMERPSNVHRFPSQDIWEDSPDSASLTTTVYPSNEEEKPQADEGLAAGAVVRTRQLSREGATAGEPIVPPRPSHPKTAEPPTYEMSAAGATAATTAAAAPPAIPSRPQQKSGSGSSADRSVSPLEGRKPPSIPDRPKPKVPIRPTKSSSQDSAEAPLTKTTSATSTGSTEEREARGPPPATKPKPSIPARPMGSKIAALQSGFISDLNNRLKIGPHAPAPHAKPVEEEEKVEEKAPLSDARKGRAKGPARRKPAASPSAPVAETKTETKKPTLSMSSVQTMWHRKDGSILVPELEEQQSEAPVAKSLEEEEETTALPSEAKAPLASEADAPAVVDEAKAEAPALTAEPDAVEHASEAGTKPEADAKTSEVPIQSHEDVKTESSLKGSAVEAEVENSPVQTEDKTASLGSTTAETATANDERAVHAQDEEVEAPAEQ